MKTLLVSFALFSLLSFSAPKEKTDPTISDYSIFFSGKGAEGTFSDLQGTIRFDSKSLKSSNFDVTVQVATISTGSSTKDKHARGDSWFDAVLYPEIGFKSSSFESLGAGKYNVTGAMSLHGVEKQVTLPFVYQAIEGGGVLESTFSINREDYSIDGPFMAFTVGDEFDVEVRVVLGN